MNEILVTPAGEELIQSNLKIAEILRRGGGEDLVKKDGKKVYESGDTEGMQRRIYLLEGVAWKFFDENSYEKPKDLIGAYSLLLSLMREKKIETREDFRLKLLKIFAYSEEIILFEKMPNTWDENVSPIIYYELGEILPDYSNVFLNLDIAFREKGTVSEILCFDALLEGHRVPEVLDQSLQTKPLSELIGG